MNAKIEDKLEKISDLEIDNKNIEKLLKTIRDDKAIIANKETELMNRQELVKKELLDEYTTLKELMINYR